MQVNSNYTTNAHFHKAAMHWHCYIRRIDSSQTQWQDSSSCSLQLSKKQLRLQSIVGDDGRRPLPARRRRWGWWSCIDAWMLGISRFYCPGRCRNNNVIPSNPSESNEIALFCKWSMQPYHRLVPNQSLLEYCFWWWIGFHFLWN